MSRRLLIMLLFLAAPISASAQSWSIEGAELRQRHADTLEDLLRELPFLRVDRCGAAGLPYRVSQGSGPLEGFLLVVDGVPMRDAWSGDNLYEEVPLALLDRVEVELQPALLDYGASAAAGVVYVWTRRMPEPKVHTRIHLSRGTYGERGRRVSFETPPGDISLAVGLDEFFGNAYFFSEISGGPNAALPATPEVSYSRRRVLTTRLDLDGEILGPIQLQLLQSSWHMDLISAGDGSWYRDVYQISMVMPDTPGGHFALSQRSLERRAWQWHSLDSALRLHWKAPRFLLPGGSLGLSSGAERHQLGLRQAGEKALLPRPAKLWASSDWRMALPGDLSADAGLRLEGEWRSHSRLLYQARLGWPGFPARMNLGLFVAGGPVEEPWQHDRMPGLSTWPQGFTAPDTLSPDRKLLRTGLQLKVQGERGWAACQFFHEQGGRAWELLETGDGQYQWRAAEAEPGNAVALQLGSRLRGGQGRAEARLSFLADLDGPHSAADIQTGYPYLGRAQLRLLRPFFSSDARLGLVGGIECRSGLENHDPLWRIDLELELRMLDARFWLRLSNAMDWAGEEIPGFPIPPSTLHMGIDWHLDH